MTDPTTELDLPVRVTDGPGLLLNDDVGVDTLTATRYTAVVVERALPHLWRGDWTTAACELDELLPLARASARRGRRRALLLDLDEVLGEECVAGVWLYRGEVCVRAAARSVAAVAAAEAWLRERLPQAEPAEESEEVPVRFWTCSGGEGAVTSRDLEVGAWDEVRENYPGVVRDRLETLIRGGEPDAAAGQLLLWYGPPGTGKTSALRALAWEWRDWCRLHYITDPEAFFGSPGYMLGALIDHEGWENDETWRLLVLEDTGELLAPDAKQATGQGLSRLLNVVDGLIGQGLRVLVLVTTNEPLQHLHPAVTRPGRCAAQIEFVPFPPEEAAAWLERNGHAEAGGARTLAELYARDTSPAATPRRPIGFSA